MDTLTRQHVEKPVARPRGAEEGHRTVSKVIGALSSSELQELLPAGAYWADVYELTALEHLTLTLWALGLAFPLQEASKVTDAVGMLLELTENLEPDEESFPYGVGLSSVFCLWHSLCLSGVAYTIYGRSLSKLVEDVRSGNDSALFKAVRVDRTIVGCPTVARRIALASFDSKPHFFRKLRGALKRGGGSYKDEYAGLRVIPEALGEAGELDSPAGDGRYRRFCEELKAYPVEGLNSGERLRKFVRRWRWSAERLEA